MKYSDVCSIPLAFFEPRQKQFGHSTDASRSNFSGPGKCLMHEKTFLSLLLNRWFWFIYLNFQCNILKNLLSYEINRKYLVHIRVRCVISYKLEYRLCN